MCANPVLPAVANAVFNAVGVRINESADFHDFYLKTNAVARELDPSRPTHGVRVAG